VDPSTSAGILLARGSCSPRGDAHLIRIGEWRRARARHSFVRLLAVALLVAGCASLPPRVEPAGDGGGCLEWVRRGGRRGARELQRDGVAIAPDLVAATAGSPEAQALARRARNEQAAILPTIGFAPVWFTGAFITAMVGSDRPRHLEPWAETTVGALLGGELLTIAIAATLAVAGDRHQRAALQRHNQGRCP
jgi:hypothetical protein